MIDNIKTAIIENDYQTALGYFNSLSEIELFNLIPWKAFIFCETKDYNQAQEIINQFMEKCVNENRIDLEFQLLIIQLRIFFHKYKFSKISQLLMDIENLLSILNKTKIPHDIEFESMYYSLSCDYFLKIGDTTEAHKYATSGISMYNSNSKDVRKILFQRQLGNIYGLKGEFSVAKEVLHDVLNYFQKTSSDKELVNTYNDLGIISMKMGETSESIEYYNLCLELLNQKQQEQTLAKIFLNLGNVYRYKGDLELAKGYYQSSHNLCLELGDKVDLTVSFNNLGLIYQLEGNYPLAMEYYIQALGYAEDTGHSILICSSYTNIGVLYDTMGDLEEAQAYLKNAYAISKKLQLSYESAGILENLAIVLQQKNKLTQSLIYLREAYDHRVKIGNPIDLGNNLYKQVIALAEVEDMEEASNILQILHELHDESGNKLLKLYDIYAQAVYHYNSTRAKYKVQAQEKFEMIINEPILDINITRQSMIYLCEILLDEFNAYHDNDALEEAISVLTKLEPLTDMIYFPKLTIETLLLKSRLFILQGHISEADALIDQSYEIASSAHLTKLVDQVNEQKLQLEELVKSSMDIAQKGSNIGNRVKKLQYKAYIKKMQKMIQNQEI